MITHEQESPEALAKAQHNRDVVAECWTCETGDGYPGTRYFPLRLDTNGATYHREQGHDVRILGGR